MTLRQIDTETPQPNGKFGESTRSANLKINANSAETETRLVALEDGTTGTGTRLDAEIEARTAADAALGARIDSEGLRIDAGHALIAQETADRTIALAAEASARAAADTAIKNRMVGTNLLINGELRYWQRRTSGRVGAGAGSLGASMYFADRFYSASLSCSTDVLRYAPPDGRTTMLCTVSGATSGASSASWMGQMIESVRTADGKVTFSVVANGNTAGLKVGVVLQQYFGAGGSPAATRIHQLGVLTLTTSPTRYSITFDLPAVAGANVGTTNDGYIHVLLELCGGQAGIQNGQFAFRDFKFERGDTATAFADEDPALLLIRCQRYFEKSYNVDIAPGTSDNTSRCALGNSNNQNGQQFTGQKFKVVKRANPSVTVWPNNDGANPTAPAGFVNQDDNTRTAVTVANIGTGGFEIIYNNGPSRWGGWYHYAADSEF